mmetsp:Transcript_11949/g.36878  ORF Transcript_11949/g.36878 Transcript_11949/m.36878 type:complete len:205 (-) Transcript_11949:69-683(-)
MRTPARVQPWGPTRCCALPLAARKGPGVPRLHVGPPGGRVQKERPPGRRGWARLWRSGRRLRCPWLEWYQDGARRTGVPLPRHSGTRLPRSRPTRRSVPAAPRRSWALATWQAPPHSRLRILERVQPRGLVRRLPQLHGVQAGPGVEGPCSAGPWAVLAAPAAPLGLREGPAAWGLALRGSGWPAGASAGASPGMTVRRGRRAA